MVPRMLECVLLPSHPVRNWGHIQRKLGIDPGGKGIEMGTSEHPVNPLEDPLKKGPFYGKNLVGTTELVH